MWLVLCEGVLFLAHQPGLGWTMEIPDKWAGDSMPGCLKGLWVSTRSLSCQHEVWTCSRIDCRHIGSGQGKEEGCERAGGEWGCALWTVGVARGLDVGSSSFIDLDALASPSQRQSWLEANLETLISNQKVLSSQWHVWGYLAIYNEISYFASRLNRSLKGNFFQSYLFW